MAIEHTIDSVLAEAVRTVGSQSAFGRLVGKSQATVHARLKDGKPIWAESVTVIEQKTGIPKWRLRPDLFEQPTGAPEAAARIEVAR